VSRAPELKTPKKDKIYGDKKKIPKKVEKKREMGEHAMNVSK
jgi:hypothetical protein